MKNPTVLRVQSGLSVSVVYTGYGMAACELQLAVAAQHQWQHMVQYVTSLRKEKIQNLKDISILNTYYFHTTVSQKILSKPF